MYIMYIQCIHYFSLTKFLHITCKDTNVPTMSTNRSLTPVTAELLPVK